MQAENFFNLMEKSVMISFSFFFHALILQLFFGLPTDASGGNETDRLALLEFKSKITEDHLRVMSSWNDSIHFCHWHGVTCGRRHQRVTRLDLQSQKLVGSISPHIGNLSFLRELLLLNNSFTHEIPSELGRLSRLQNLRLDNNSLSGEIPVNITSCFNLDVISLVYNRLIGKIPSEIGLLSKLHFLYIHANNLTGWIPPSLGNLSSLEGLSLTRNNLDGSVPDALGQLKNLSILKLAENSFSGTIPSSIFNLSSITAFDLGMNQLHGSLPVDMGITLPNLELFRISYNQFTGSIPVSISNASNLLQIMTVVNELTGKVPTLEKLHRLQWLSITSNHLGNRAIDDLNFLSSLTNATNLEKLNINGNQFGGLLPESIGNLSTKLAMLLLDNNRIGGGIPTGIGNLVGLGRLEVWNNQFSKTIPSDIGKLQNLQVLYLSDNKFTGIIPSSLGNLEKLIELHLGGNNLQGSIPSSLGKCQNLLLLNLSHNNISGTIPSQVISLSSLSIFIDLSRNLLTGVLPIEVGNLRNLGILDVSENMLSGEIPSTVGNCVSLEILHMEGNFLYGAIPSSLRYLRGIQILDLSRNNLSGKIPEFLEGVQLLQNLNLSYNYFEGKVPIEGIFKNASATSVMGNSKLCGGIPEFHLPMCNFKESEKRGLILTLKLVICVSALLGVSYVLCFLYLCWFKKRRNENLSTSSENALLRVSYQSLLKATDGFSSANLIGVGSFGSVYRGILSHDRTVIAVKVLNLLRQGASKSFIVECEALRNIKHRNLVKILTACSSVDFHGNDFKALVYEFMVNGSLEEWLHPAPEGEKTREAPRMLDFLYRLNIAIDVACALDYLHHHCQTPIVHCDLKPSNVLLDNEMVGHVSDFGLARFHSNVTDNISSNQTSSIGIRGSIGYTAPEYGLGSEVSTYGDVYSYGILLLEMFTGKRPTDELFKDGLNLHNFTKMALPEQVARITETILLQGEGGTIPRIEECLTSIFRIGISCSMESPRERPNISDVAAELHVIKDILLGRRTYGERNIIQLTENLALKREPNQLEKEKEKRAES